MSATGKSSPGGAEFAEFKDELETKHGVRFFSRVEDVPPAEEGVKRLAIISARECIDEYGYRVSTPQHMVVCAQSHAIFFHTMSNAIFYMTTYSAAKCICRNI